MPIPPPPTVAGIAARCRDVLPARWFPDDAPVLDTLLTGLASVWAVMFEMLEQVRLQTRTATATGAGLDRVAADFFGARLRRRVQQGDASLRTAIQRELLRERATRGALGGLLAELSGQAPAVFEPARPADTGAWGLAGGYGVAGGWGSLALPFQCFVEIAPAASAGPGGVAGWNIGAGWGVGPVEYAGSDMLQGPLTAAEIRQAIADVLPAGAIAWVRVRG